MDFAVSVDSNGVGMMTWEKSVNQETNVYLSLNLSQGSMFNNPEFGLKLDDIKKVTNNSIALIKERYEKALQWMLDAGKIKSLKVTVERDSIAYSRINAKIEILQNNDEPVTYTEFRTIGGPSGSFVVP